MPIVLLTCCSYLAYWLVYDIDCPVHWNRTQCQVTMVFGLSTTESQCPRIVVVTGRSGHSPALCNFSIIVSLKLGSIFMRGDCKLCLQRCQLDSFPIAWWIFRSVYTFRSGFFPLTTMLCSRLASSLFVRKEAVCPGQIWALLSTQRPWSAELAGSGFSTWVCFREHRHLCLSCSFILPPCLRFMMILASFLPGS